MIVSHELKLLFAHIPRTGGSSITAALRPYIETDVPECEQLPVDARGWQQQWHALGRMHSSFVEVRDRAEALIADGYRLMVCSRSPYERMASMWRAKGEGTGLSPYEYLSTKLPLHCLRTVFDATGGNPVIVLAFDELQRDWAGVFSVMGIEPNDLPRANQHGEGVTLETMQTVFSDPRCIEFVLKHFGSDISAFSYTLPWETPAEEISEEYANTHTMDLAEDITDLEDTQ